MNQTLAGLALGLALLGCGLPPINPEPTLCTTSCNLRLSGSADCASLSSVELKADEALQSIHISPCAELAGWRVVVESDKPWEDFYATDTGQPKLGLVSGLTYCASHSIKLTSDFKAFAHEAIHAHFCPASSPHNTWPAEYWQAIDKANEPPFSPQ